ncbi:MAG: FtsQ-type POTRA domain-containing protein [Clostridia bacterium]|nr:FtsQ-type POTRA domain-containing protein [Clostridia bacterium]
MGFIKRHKKLVIILSIIFVVLLTSIILTFTLFSLKGVTLEFKTETSILTEEEQQEIIDEVSSEEISTLLFFNKQKLISKLEKDFPYLKIVNIETVYPSNLVIHSAEREEFYAIESNDNVYYLDEELKILKIEEGSFNKTQYNAILLNIADLNLNIIEAEAGQFITFGEQEAGEMGEILANDVQNVLLNLLTAFEVNNRNIAIIRANYQSFEVNLKYQEAGDSRIWFVCLSIIDNLGFETEIIEINKLLDEKIGVMFDIVNELATNEPERLLNEKLIIFENSNNEIAYVLNEIE